MSEKGAEEKSKSMADDYFFLTWLISKISGNSPDIRKRFCSYIFIGLPLVIAIPLFVKEVYGLDIYEYKTTVLIAIWMLIAPILIDYFEYIIDNFKEEFKKSIVEGDRGKFDALIKKILDKNKTRKVTGAISILVHIFVSLIIPRALPEITYWSDLHWIMIIISYPISLMTSIILYLVAKNVYYMRDICSEKFFRIEVDPYSGDRFGNLSFIGNYSILITVLLSTFSFGIPHAYVRMRNLTGWERMMPMALMGLILLAILITFFVPLYHVNRLAARKKRALLEKESEKLKELFKKIDKEGVDTTDIRNRYYVHLEHYRNIVNMREWPFDTKTFIALIGSILLPIIFTALPYIVGTP